MKKLLLSLALVLSAAVARADDPITGGDWSVDGDYTNIKS